MITPKNSNYSFLYITFQDQHLHFVKILQSQKSMIQRFSGRRLQVVHVQKVDGKNDGASRHHFSHPLFDFSPYEPRHPEVNFLKTSF